MRHKPLTHVYLYVDFLERVIGNDKEMKLLAIILLTGADTKFGQYLANTDGIFIVK